VSGLWAADARLFHLLAGHPAWARDLAQAFLWLSTRAAVWLVLFGLAFVAGGRRGRRIAVTGLCALLLAHAASAWALMGLVQRPGPAETLPGVVVLLRHPPPFSFPAERSAMAFAAAPFLTRGNGAAPVAVWLLALGISWAQVYGGACFPTDVAAGAAVGLCCARAAVWLLGNPFRRARGQLVPLPRRLRSPQPRRPGPGL
jgi:membrane-associated phospholipid phosphatase